MNTIDVKVIKLDAMRVICFNGFGEAPEERAMQQLFGWAREHRQHGRVFGYNNPNPSAGSSMYGYDAWMEVDANVQAEGEGRIIDFPGGLYAVARSEVMDAGNDIPNIWQALVHWREGSRYHEASHQWLEEQIAPQTPAGNDGFTLDLYLPVRE